MPWPVTINGKTYTAAMFQPYAYVTYFPAIVQDVADVGVAAEAARNTIVGAVGTAQQLAAAMQAGPVASVNGKTGVAFIDPLDASPAPATRDLRFREGFAPDSGTFQRLSAGYRRRASGLYESVASGGLRIDHGPDSGANRGAMIEEARTNTISNSSMQGAAAGTPGTLPTNWSDSRPAGVNRQIVGIGTENGIDYIDLRYSGSGGEAAFGVQLEIGLPAAALGQTWTGSVFARKLAETNAAARMVLTLYEISSAYEGVEAALNLATTAPLGQQRFSATRTNIRANTTNEGLFLTVFPAASGAWDFTYRIGWPQLERGAFASSPIRTTSAAATRAGDAYVIPAGSDWFNPVEGTFYVEARSEAPDSGTQIVCGLSNTAAPSFSNCLYLSWDQSARAGLLQFSGGIAQANITAAKTQAKASRNRFAFSYGPAGLLFSANGEAAAAAAVTALPAGMDRLVLGSAPWSVGDNALGGSLYRLAYVPRGLSATILQRMTS